MDAFTPISATSSNPSGGSNPPNPSPNPTGPVSGEDPLLGGGSSTNPTANELDPPKTAPRARRSSKDFTWLPHGWRIEDKVRTGGATAGYVDKYYVDPATGHKFRSKNEVMAYLETGSIRKPKTSGEDSSSRDAANTYSGSSGNNTKEDTGKEGKPAIPTFDPSDVPDSVEWVLTDAEEDIWTPYIGGAKVDDKERATWDEFELVSVNRGNQL